MVKAGRHHAHNLDCLPVELNRASNDVWIASKTARPKTIGQDDNVVGARLELFRFEYTATLGRHAQHRKEIGRCRETEQTFRRVPIFGQVTADEVVSGHLVENRVPVVLVEKVSSRMRPTLRMWRGAKYSHETLGLRVGQRTKEKRIQHAEHRCIDANAESQRKRRHHGKTL